LAKLIQERSVPGAATATTETAEDSLTGPGTALGTVAYMSPEQALGKELDARSDLFSLGVVLYEMATGTLPFKGDSSVATFDAILHKTPTAPVRLNPECSAELEGVINHLLEKDRDLRCQHAADLRAELKRLKRDSDSSKSAAHPRVKAQVVGRSKIGYRIAATALVIIAAGTWAFLRFFPREAVLPPPRIVPLTTSGGHSPALSPDGNWVAFQWWGEKRDNWDIYVKEVDGPGFNRLTTNPADDGYPAWSPDGRQIAFLRASGDRGMLYLISPLGGGERKVAEVGSGPVSWSPDGKSIAFADRKSPKDPWSIWSLLVQTLEKKQMTAPNVSYLRDSSPAFSPDGRYLAFVRGRERPALYVMRLPRGDPKFVTDFNSPESPCWTADSREVVFNTRSPTGESALWKISVDGGEPRRVPARGEWLSQPVISRNRLAYVNPTGGSRIWKLNLTDNKATKEPSKPLFSWSSSEAVPRISPDGSRIVFWSNSSGNGEVWICNADGTKPMRITDMKAKATGSPDWSPDGKNIAFDSTKSGNIDIYVVSAEGGPVRRITTDPADHAVPRWSRDGRWIYFGSNRSGSWQIWKVQSDGGRTIQITKEGGLSARESLDGYVYFHGYYNLQKKGVWRVPVSGGPETLVLDMDTSPHNWDLTVRGVYFIDQNAKPVATVSFYDFKTRAVRSLAPVSNDPAFTSISGLSVSPDGKWLLYCGGVFTPDIMLIDNFR
jgi:Tol biopolymer transport system component